MEKIIITGNETKQSLQNLMEGKIQYSKVDSKQKLLERIDKYNNSFKAVIKVDNKSVGYVKSISIPVIQTENYITGNQYCNIKGYNKRIKFFINKKYKDEKYTQVEWQEIFKKEGLI
jgi:hypothetical protein